MAVLRLTPAPVAAHEPEPDASQRAAIAAVAERGHVVVTGAAGSGKTTAVVAIAADAVRRAVSPDRLLVLAPTRHAAAALRDRVGAALGVATVAPVARTPAALAFAILAARAERVGEPRPVLVTGAEQDVVLRELLEGHASGRVAPLDWGNAVTTEATALAAFRHELRDLLMRAAEADLPPSALRDLGERARRPEWVAAATLYDEYEAVMALRSGPQDQGARFDPASIVARAADALADWQDEVGGDGPRWDVVVVDDYQDATAAVTALLGQLARRGAQLVLVGNADESVQGFRGAVPGGLASATASPWNARVVELTTSHRQTGTLAAVSAAVAMRVGVKGVGSAREAARAAVGTGEGQDVVSLTAPHRYGQSRAIAAELRRSRHGLAGQAVPWGRMAVIARSAATLRAIRSDLLSCDIPCEALGEGTALHREPAVAPLITIVRAGLTPAAEQVWSEDDAMVVLTSRLVGLDPVGVRRLRRELLREERAGGGARTSAELLVEALADPSRLATVRGPEADAALRAARAVAAVRARAAHADATPGAVVWSAWEALGVAASWRAGALAGSSRDDADLDAVIALLRAAQTFTERLPEAGTATFLDSLEGQDFAADSLGAKARGADVVSFATPAGAQGREWDVVVIAGLEEGAWPQLRLRDSVLGAQRLADALADGLPGAAERATGAADQRAARAAVLDDETRALLVAASRARSRLIITAVDDGETRPSRFASLIEDAAGIESTPASVRRGTADLREAVAAVRGLGVDAALALMERPGDEAAQRKLEGAARTLARLVRLDVAGAAPEQWHGVPQPSTDQPLWDDEQPVPVSPSKIDVVRACGLKWALEAAGGTPESSDAQRVGTLVHEIAAALPQGSLAELTAALDERWPLLEGAGLGSRDTWVGRVQYERAKAMIARLAAYLRDATADEVRVEQGFRVQIGRAIVAGMADRLEVHGHAARVVDLKTGRPVSVAEAGDHGQLMLYQLATLHGGFEGVEQATDAALVFLGGTTVSPAVRVQPAVDPGAAREVLASAVETMAASTFEARVNPLCEHCPVRRACPAHASGRQVSEP